MSSIRLQILLLISLGLLAGCASAPKPTPPSPPPSADAWLKSMTSAQGNVWCGSGTTWTNGATMPWPQAFQLIAIWPDGTQIEMGVNTNTHQLFWRQVGSSLAISGVVWPSDSAALNLWPDDTMMEFGFNLTSHAVFGRQNDFDMAPGNESLKPR